MLSKYGFFQLFWNSHMFGSPEALPEALEALPEAPA